ncbi:MAG: DUF1289 domain-containing protein [Alphaproteobacteria bacterium]|nr:DUF1289 domain-containing protein [Alphaproteobacteria bacterium]
MIESPCIKVCTLEAESGLCIGCGRSLDEIARWSSMPDVERQAIVRGLPDRLAAMPQAAAITSAKQA